MYHFARCQPHSKRPDLQGWYLILEPGDIDTLEKLHRGVAYSLFAQFGKDPHGDPGGYIIQSAWVPYGFRQWNDSWLDTLHWRSTHPAGCCPCMISRCCRPWNQQPWFGQISMMMKSLRSLVGREASTSTSQATEIGFSRHQGTFGTKTLCTLPRFTLRISKPRTHFDWLPLHFTQSLGRHSVPGAGTRSYPTA